MFVLACALQRLDVDELAAFTQAMIDCGSSLRFDAPIVADKHCIGGVPGNRTTMIVVPILASTLFAWTHGPIFQHALERGGARAR